MKRYLAPLLALKLGITLTSTFAGNSLQADISETLNRQHLIKDWNREYSKKPAASLSKNVSAHGLNQNFFPIEADLPLSKPNSYSSKGSVGEAIKELNDALAEALSHEPENDAEPSPEEAFAQEGSHQSPVIAQAEPNSLPETTSLPVQPPNGDDRSQPILIRFNNVSIIEYLRFISGISHKNFIFDENDLQFNITMISEEPTSIDDFMTALLQELRIHDLTLLEQGNNLVIHKNPRVNNVSTVITDESGDNKTQFELVTQVFRLNTIDVEKLAAIVRPLTSERALVETISDTNHLILTDLVSNVVEIGKLIRTLDSPKGGLVIGQYVLRTTTIDTILPIVQLLMDPIAAEKPIQYVPYAPSNSIFIVSTPFLVEKALSFLQHLDQNQKSTKVLDLNGLKYNPESGQVDEHGQKALTSPGLFINDKAYVPTEEPSAPAGPSTSDQDGWRTTQEGQWTFKVLTPPGQQIDPNRPPQGKWTIDPKGNWLFIPGASRTIEDEMNQPRGAWELDAAGNWNFELDKSEGISIHVITRSAPEREELLPGSKPKGQFFLHKVHYRKGDDLQRSFQNMAESLRETENIDPDLVNALISAQWIESSNSIMFSGTPEAMKKISMLVEEIDVPLRQVFIEMLILEATLVDALNYSVKWGNRFGGGNWAGGDGFDSTNPSPLTAALNSAGVNNLGKAITISPQTGLPVLGQVLIPNPTPFNGSPGFDLGIIGQRIFNKVTGIEFESIGAFINCLRAINTTNIILNPKIISEDGVPAEIFVGENIAYQTQSIVNDQGVILTSNFEYLDVGTRLKVTPYIGSSNIIALEIEVEITNVITAAQAGVPSNSNVGPNTSKSSTVTRVHIPSGFFLVISGMLRDDTIRIDAHAPCLGGIPIIGAAFKDKRYDDQKRNIMIFMQPKIIDTEEEMQNLTKHQQDLLKVKNRRKKDMLYETEEFMDFLNLKKYEHERTSIEFEDEEDPL